MKHKITVTIEGGDEQLRATIASEISQFVGEWELEDDDAEPFIAEAGEEEITASKHILNITVESTDDE